MNNSADDIIHTVVDALQRQVSACGGHVPALASVHDLVANDEADTAIDHLVDTVNAFRLTLRRDEYDLLLSAATRLGCADSVTDIAPELLADLAFSLRVGHILLLTEPRPSGQSAVRAAGSGRSGATGYSARDGSPVKEGKRDRHQRHPFRRQ